MTHFQDVLSSGGNAGQEVMKLLNNTFSCHWKEQTQEYEIKISSSLAF